MEIKKQRKRISKGLKRKRILKGGNWDDVKVWIDNVGSNIDKTGKDWADAIESVKKELLEKLDKATKELFEGINADITKFEKTDDYTKIKDNKEQKTEYEKWKTFINTFYIYKCDNEKCEVKMYVDKLKEVTDDDEILTEEEARNMASGLMRRIEIIGRKRIMVPKCDDEKAVDCQTQQVEQQELTLEQKEDKVIVDFDEIFKSILFKVNIFFGKKKSTKECSQPFRNMISLLKALPNIDNNLGALVKEDIKGLEGRYNTIVGLLKEQCSGMGMSFICGTAASALGNDISALYKKLKKSSENLTTTTIDKTTLLGFISDIVPVMITNLTGITEFKEEIRLLTDIKEDKVIKQHISKSPKGGKKSSGTVRKEILGKLMKIYKIPNDKKEYVRHKGHLITIKQFKGEAKEANHAKPVAKHTKKLILGKERCIYKVQGSKKEHIKYKGALIPVADYKKLMGA